MAITVEAIYENGVLRLSEPLPLAEHEKVSVTVAPKTNWVQETAGNRVPGITRYAPT